MSYLLYINFYNLNSIFEYTGECIKYKLFRYSKLYHDKLQLSIFDFKNFFFKEDNLNIPKITKTNLLDYYYYLKRKYVNKFSLQEIKSYYILFFCKYLDENNIVYELNTSHELAIDILLCDSLKKINLILNINDYKQSYITENIEDRDKKPFLQLFQVMFQYGKVSQIKIISKNDEKTKQEEYNTNIYENLFINLLIDNCFKCRQKIKTNILKIYELIESKYCKFFEIYKSLEWELIVPYNSLFYDNMKRNENIEKNIKFDVDLNRAFNIKHLDFIKANKIKNYFLELEYLDLWSFDDNFKNVKKLEIRINDIIKNIDNLNQVPKRTIQIEHYNIGRGRGRGRGGIFGKNNDERSEEIKQKYNYNNRKYIQYFNNFFELYISHKNNTDDYFNLKLLNFLEKSEFEDLTILIDNHRFSLNKLTKSIEFTLFHKEKENSQLFKKLTQYESVKLNSSYHDELTYNLFLFDKVSNIKYFYLDFYTLEFPIDFEKLITLDLAYYRDHDENETYDIHFPLFEKNCKYIFYNLKNLKLKFDYRCNDCISDLITFLSCNLKYCPVLENFELINGYSHFNDIKNILEGIKFLKYLRRFYLSSEHKEKNKIKITTDDFYKAYPEYYNFCPFLNDININISEFYIYNLLYEKKIDYKINDIVINDYLYIKTLGEKDYYSTYLCKNKKDEKVVIRKFKKSRINYSLDLFENEKYCLIKFKDNPNIIKYIEFLEDEHFEYIVYEYIDNSIKHFIAGFLRYKIFYLLYDILYLNAKKDPKIILLPIFPLNFIIKNNFDVILIGFGYLNLKFINDDINEKYFYFYNKEYFKQDILTNYIDNTTYFSFQYFYSFIYEKDIDFFRKKEINKKYYKNLNKIKISKEIKLEKELNIGKIIPLKDYIFTMQNYSIVIYINNKDKINKITDIHFPEKEENLINFIVIDDNILIVLNSSKIYLLSFDNNQLNINNVIEYKYLKEKFNINLHIEYENENNKDIFFKEMTYIKDLNIIFTSGKIVCSWELNKKKKKLNFLKFYRNLNFYNIFNSQNNNYAQLIAIGEENLIFYNMDKNFNLINVFEHSIDSNYSISPFMRSFVSEKLFKQDKNYFYVYVLNAINILKIDFQQKKIENLFSSCMDISDANCILPFKNGLLLGCNVPFFVYLTKVKDKFEFIENISYLKNDIIFDMKIYNDYLYVIGNENILILEIK